MARERKTPKPKQPAYERIHRDADPLGAFAVLDETLERFGAELTAEDCRIALAWRHGWKKNKDGQIVLGKCKKVGELDKQFAAFDFVIILNNAAWRVLDADQRLALMHHELCHAAVSFDQNNNVKKDARGRTTFRTRKHDVEEFAAVIEHHGCYLSDIENLCLAAMRSKKPPTLPGLEPEKAAGTEPSTNGHPSRIRGPRRPAPKTRSARK